MGSLVFDLLTGFLISSLGFFLADNRYYQSSFSLPKHQRFLEKQCEIFKVELKYAHTHQKPHCYSLIAYIRHQHLSLLRGFGRLSNSFIQLRTSHVSCWGPLFFVYMSSCCSIKFDSESNFVINNAISLCHF